MRGLRQDGEDEARDFWATLEDKLRGEVGMTKAQFAEKIGISAQGLASWKERNQFRRSSLAVAAKLLRWPELDEDTATKRYRLNLIEHRIVRKAEPEDGFVEQLRRVNRAYRRIEKRFKDYGKLTLPVIDQLGEGGFFAFSACTTSPFEFENTKEGDPIAIAIAQALHRGVLFLYIRPTEKGLTYYSRKWGYGRVVGHDEAVKEIEAFRALVKGMLIEGKVVKDKKMTPEDAERLVYERLDQCYVDRSPMWMPGVGLSMLGQFRARELTGRVAMSLPGGKFGGVLIYPQYYSLEFRFGRFLRKVVLDACREIKCLNRGESASGRVQLSLSNKHRKHTENFYDRYSQILRTVSSIEPPGSALA